MRGYSITDKNEEIGACFLIYGKPGVGKTYSIRTMPDPILVVVTEPRDPRLILKNTNKKIRFVEPESFDECMDFLNELYQEYAEGKGKYKSVALDSLSFLQSRFKTDLEDSRFEEAIIEKKRRDTLVDRFRIERGDWGGLASMMKRLTWLLNRISKYNVLVVATATVIEYPSWDTDISAAPSFQGIEYPSLIQGYFDFIGFVTPGNPNPYPPVVRFVSDGTFVAKSCSTKINERKGKGVLDFERILKAVVS